MSAAAVQPMPVTAPPIAGTLMLSALAYARRGWRVHPLKPRTKLPATQHGCLDATTDEATIIAWWKRWPNANIGLATGHRFWVLDVDTKHADAAEWLESVELPETVTQVTGTGGRHFLYALPGFDVANSTSKIASHIDVRGIGGYIVAAPSVHPDTGRQYAWDTEADIPTEEPAAAPAWLLEKLRPTDMRKTPVTVPLVIKHGVQHETIFKTASSLRAKGLQEHEILPAVVAFSKRCEIVPPEANVAKIVADVCKRYPAGPSAEFNRQGDQEQGQPETEGRANWKNRLFRKDQTVKQTLAGELGKPLANHANIMIALEHAPEWAGVFIFNELKQRVEAVKQGPIRGRVPRAWIDGDNIESLVWFQRNGIGVVSCEMLGSSIDAFARRHTVNHLKDYLNGIVWDGVNRVDTWLNTYFGVDCSDLKTSHYVSAVGRYWLISAAARVLKPGPVQADHMLVLEGYQGIGKSTALRALAGHEYFSDALPDISTKDAQDHAVNYWVIEMSELSAIRKAEVEAIKNFMGKQEEKFRRPYGHIEQTVRRYCVFAGTTNKSDYLKDETGNRRFWPVKCTRADVEGITRDRDQLWAEAVALYRDGVMWWPESETLIAEMSAQQAERMECDVWHAKIAAYVDGRDKVTAVDVLTDIGIELHRMTQIDRNRAGRCLRALGYEFSRTRELGRCYVRGGK